MRRYRYDFSPKTKRWLRFSHIAYFFFAWNAAAICIYQFYVTKTPIGEEFENLSGTQKYLRMISDPKKEERLEVVSMQGLNVKDRRETTIGDFLKERPETVEKSE